MINSECECYRQVITYMKDNKLSHSPVDKMRMTLI